MKNIIAQIMFSLHKQKRRPKSKIILKYLLHNWRRNNRRRKNHKKKLKKLQKKEQKTSTIA